MNELLPAFNCFDKNVFVDEALKDWNRILGEDAKYATPMWDLLLTEGSPNGTESMQAAVQDLMLGEKTPEEVAREFQEKLSVWYGK